MDTRLSEQALLVLDLDETLIRASETEPETGFDFRVGPYFVVKRPHLDRFLVDVGKSFRLAVWTSSSEAYARGIVEHVMGDRIALQFVWTRNQCTVRVDPETQERHLAKNLAKVKRRGYRLERVLILDDEPEKVRQSYGNHLRVRPFESDADDRELLDLLPYLDSIKNHPDFRSLDKRPWRRKV